MPHAQRCCCLHYAYVPAKATLTSSMINTGTTLIPAILAMQVKLPAECSSKLLSRASVYIVVVSTVCREIDCTAYCNTAHTSVLRNSSAEPKLTTQHNDEAIPMYAYAEAAIVTCTHVAAQHEAQACITQTVVLQSLATDEPVMIRTSNGSIKVSEQHAA
eukprot:14064-Heterococcus_DN1.PRE.6